MSRDQRDDPRVIAAQVLLAVETDDAYVNLLLPARLAKTHLSARDKAFATELTYGTQRLQGRYDWIIPGASTGRSASSTLRSASFCGWASTSFWGCASPPTPPCRPRSTRAAASPIAGE